MQNSPPAVLPEWSTAEELAAWLRIEVKALYWLNYTRKGPRPHKIAGKLRYRRANVEMWLKAQAG